MKPSKIKYHEVITLAIANYMTCNVSHLLNALVGLNFDNDLVQSFTGVLEMVVIRSVDPTNLYSFQITLHQFVAMSHLIFKFFLCLYCLNVILNFINLA